MIQDSTVGISLVSQELIAVNIVQMYLILVKIDIKKSDEYPEKT
jgi:hypothetical protein